MTLPSNSSMKLHPDNTTSSYKVMLPRRYELENYEVALTEIHYPQTLHNFTRDRHCIKICEAENLLNYKECIVPDGVYLNIQHLIHTFNTYEREDNKSFKMELMNDGRIILYSKDPELRLNMPEDMSRMMGFSPDQDEFFERKLGVEKPNLNLGLPQTLYVYSNIVEAKCVGDVMARLLRVIRIPVKTYMHGGKGFESFTHPQYVPVALHSFQDIEIAIKDELGKPAPFTSGSLIVVFHFRKINK